MSPGPTRRRSLPTGRTVPRQQIRVLAQLAELAETQGGQPVTRTALVERTAVNGSTITECMPFLEDLGLVTIPSRSLYAITPWGAEIATAWDQDHEQARRMLHPLMQGHWAASEAARLLRGGPLPQEELARLLRTGLPGMPARGTYLVEWLTMGLIVQRDERLRISLASMNGAAPAGAPETGATDADNDWDASGDESILLGVTIREVQALPAAQFASFCGAVVQTIRAFDTHA